MSTKARPETRHWYLPGGVIAFPCIAEDCPEIATSVVRGIKGMEWPLCPGHWQVIRRQTRGLIEVLRLLERPACFRPDCDDEAVAVMEDLDGRPLPVCQTHWDDLSWVTPPSSTASARDRAADRWLR